MSSLEAFVRRVMLVCWGVASGTESVPRAVSVPAVVQATSSTFDQQKELLALQFEQERLKRQMEREEMFELEKMWQDTEKARLELEQYRLQFINGQAFSGEF